MGPTIENGIGGNIMNYESFERDTIHDSDVEAARADYGPQNRIDQLTDTEEQLWPCSGWSHGLMCCRSESADPEFWKNNFKLGCLLYKNGSCSYYNPNKEPDECALHEHRSKMGAWPYGKEV